MTYGNDYRLAEKMKSRFSGRGAALSGMQASTTSELMKRAQMGGDPSVNCSELDFRNGAAVNRRTNPSMQTMQNGGYRPQYAQYANDPAYAGRSRSAGTGCGQNISRNVHPNVNGNANNPRPSPQNGGQTQTQNQNPSAAYANANANARRSMQGNTARPGTGNRKNTNVKKTQKAKNKAKPKPKAAPGTEEITEVKVEGRRMTPMFAVFLVIGTMMIMSIVLSFSEIYQTTSEIAQLESDLADLKDTAAQLELKLEEKNDIRVIEQIATEELGMVKEDAVQRKYLSLSDGERIDIIEDENADSATKASGVLLSSIWSSLGSLFDYFR